MPGRNGTGPMGMGPMTGRGFGFCKNGLGRRNCLGTGYKRRGYGMGFGPGYGYNQSINQKEFLENEKEYLKAQIEQIDKELEEL